MTTVPQPELAAIARTQLVAIMARGRAPTCAALHRAGRTLKNSCGVPCRNVDGYRFGGPKGRRQLHIAEVDLKCGPNTRFVLSDADTSYWRARDELVGLGAQIHAADRVWSLAQEIIELAQEVAYYETGRTNGYREVLSCVMSAT